MKKTLFALAFLSIFAVSTVQADVVVTFDNDLESFIKGGDGTAATWSSVNGGSMQLTADGGWAGFTGAWGGVSDGMGGFSSGIQTDPLALAELQLANANGGTVSYDIIIQEVDQTYDSMDPPDWFQSVVSFNSVAGFDQEVVNHGLNDGAWPLAGGVFTDTITMDILPGTDVDGDGNAQWDGSGGWGNIAFGLNNQGSQVTTAVIYIDNITISANDVVPEPTALCLLGLGGVLMTLRRRR